MLPRDDVLEQWAEEVASQRRLGLRRTPTAWRARWQQVFAGWPHQTLGPPPLWVPDDDARTRSGFAGFLSATGFGEDALQEGYAWSVDSPDEFWGSAVNYLGIQFQRPPHSVWDAPGDNATPRWFPGARLNIVTSCFQQAGDQPAIVASTATDGVQVTSYAALRDMVQRVVAGLRHLGCEPGTPVAVFLPMTTESVAAYLGIVAAGCVAVSIADSFAAPEISRRLQIAGAAAVITVGGQSRGGKTLDTYGRLLGAEPPPTIVIGESRTPLRDGDLTWAEFLSHGASPEWTMAEPHDATGILFSSGTTGDPKAIVWDHTTPMKCAVDGRLLHDIREEDVVVWPTNLGWMMGPWLIYATLINRGTIGLYHEAPVDEHFGAFVASVNVRMLGVVPDIGSTLAPIKVHGISRLERDSLFQFDGEVSAPDDMFYLSSLAGMRPVIEYCGGTEIGGGYISSTPLHANVPGCFATPAWGSRFVILDSDNGPAEEGTLYLVPPALGLSRELLHRDHEATYFAGAPRGPQGERLRKHGDHFQRLPGGYFRAGGRTDDTMNLGGVKISSAEIESVVAHPLVRELAAVGVPTEQGGPDELVVFVVPEHAAATWDQAAVHDAMTAALRSRLNPLFKIARLEVVDRLPRTASNKIVRRALRAEGTQDT